MAPSLPFSLAACRRRCLPPTVHFAAPAFAGASPGGSGGGGSVTQIGRSKVSGYSVTPSRLTGSSCMRRSAQATCKMLPLGIALTSQTRAVLSSDAVTIRDPSGLKGGSIDPVLVAAKDGERFAGGRVPHAHGVVPRRSDDARPVVA